MGLVHRIGIFAVLLGQLPAAAVAGDEGFSHTGPYLGVGGSYVTDTFESDLEDALGSALPGVTVDIEESAGVNAVVGYRILSFLAVEAEYEWIDEFDIRLFGANAFSLEAQSVTGNLKWMIPTWRVQPYLLTGVGFTRWRIRDEFGLGLSDTTTDLAGRVGVGLDVYLTRHVLVTAGASAVLSATEFRVAGQDVGPIFYVGGQAGLQYRF